MKTTTRTDPHRPGAILPCDYRFVLWYVYANSSPSYGINCVQDRAEYRWVDGRPVELIAAGRHNDDNSLCCVLRLREMGAKMAPTGAAGKCSICGASFNSGEVWVHEPTGEHIHVGNDCAAKYGLDRDRSEWQAWQKRQTALRSQAAKDKRFKVAALRFLEARPDLKAALDLAPAEVSASDSFEVCTLRDMRDRLSKYGSMSDRAVEYALVLAGKVRNPEPPKAEEAHVPAPTGRVSIRGLVVSTKTVEGYTYGSEVLKMIVKVQADGGVWLVYCTVPDSLLDGDGPLRGKEVEFSATLTPGRDPHFAFGSRPTKARVIEAAPAV